MDSDTCMAKNSKNVLAWLFFVNISNKMYIINNTKHICKMFTATIFPSFILTAGEDLVIIGEWTEALGESEGTVIKHSVQSSTQASIMTNTKECLQTIFHLSLSVFCSALSLSTDIITVTQYWHGEWAGNSSTRLVYVTNVGQEIDQFLSGLGASAVLNLFSISSSVSRSVCWA